MSQPNYEIGMEDIMLSFEMSSSGDELLMSLPDPQEIEIPISRPSSPIPSTSTPTTGRFGKTTESDRNKILEQSESDNTKAATKGAVKIFKSNV